MGDGWSLALVCTDRWKIEMFDMQSHGPWVSGDPSRSCRESS